MFPVTITTIYTRERLLRFQKAVLRGKLPVTILIACCNLIVLLCDAFLLLINALDADMILGLVLMVVIDAIYVLMTVVLPRVMTKKAKNLNIEVTMTFEMDALSYTAASDLVSEQSSIKYVALRRVLRCGDDLYLFLDPRQALLVDLSEQDAAQLDAIRTALEAALGAKRVRWME